MSGMPRFADPSRCPDCGLSLPPDPLTCPTCSLPLQGPLASELLVTLGRADQLLVQLRASAPALVGAAVGGPAAPVTGPAGPAPSRTSDLPAYPSAPRPPVRTGLTAASVPKILLGLGALALLVAAVIFLSVAWSALGVGGRTAVLVAFTLASGALGLELHRRDLKVAGEALLTVSLGLLTLDVVGAADAGWLGDLGDGGLLVAVGGALLAVTGALLGAGRRLVTAQVVAPLGLVLVGLGLLASLDTPPVLAVTGICAVVVVAAVALAYAGRRRQLTPLLWAGLAAAALWWSGLVLGGLVTAAEHASLRGLWAEGHSYPLLVGAALALLPVVLAPTRAEVVLGARATAAVVGTVGLGMVVTDDGSSVLLGASLVAALAWTAASLAGQRAKEVARFPWAAAALCAGVLGAQQLSVAVARLLSVGEPYTRAAGVRLDPRDPVLAQPFLLVPAVAVLVAGALVLFVGAALRRRLLVPVTVLALVVAGVATLALYPLPLAAPVAALALAGLALAAVGRHRSGLVEPVAAQVLGTLALLVALPNGTLAAAAALVLAATAVVVMWGGREAGAGVVLPGAIAAGLWSAFEAADLAEVHRAVPILVATGLLALWRHRDETDASFAVVAVAVTTASTSYADRPLTALAVDLTVTGALVVVAGLVHEDRRLYLRIGALVLAAATWARLADVGVTAPEAYTLPLAVALTLIGVRRLQREPGIATAPVLAPGLVLATVPSLLWVLVLEDPVTLRAALLGLSCLALLFAGTRLRWNAPVVVGAVAGLLLLLRELAPVVAETPQWVVIALAGVALTVVGVTWERRLRDVQSATAYLERLR